MLVVHLRGRIEMVSGDRLKARLFEPGEKLKGVLADDGGEGVRVPMPGGQCAFGRGFVMVSRRLPVYAA